VFLALCLSALPLPVRAAPDRAEAQPAVQEHVIRFYLDPALVPDPDFARTVLPKYVADMNFILEKNTSRRLVFDPATGVILKKTQPHSNSAMPPLPDNGFEIWAHAVLTSHSISHGGYGGIDWSGAGVLAGLKWTRLYDPDHLTAASLPDYWTQINNMLHELAHVFGAGYGEYYRLSMVRDATGAEPRQDIDLNDRDDPFWNEKPDFLTDPLLRNAAITPGSDRLLDRAALLDHVRFSQLTAAIISSSYRNSAPMVDLSRLNLRIVDEGGSPLEGANIRIWSVVGAPPYQAALLTDGLTGPDGEFSFAWGGPANPHNSYDFLRLIKVYRDGYQSAAKYISIFDTDIARLVEQRALYSATVTLRASATAPAATFGDVPPGYFALPAIEKLFNVGVTGGCSTSPLLYCPEQAVTRAQMAVFLERSMKGAGFTPPTVQTVFNDTGGHWAQTWIDALAADQITSGCGNRSFCPDSTVTRAQMAVFLLRARYGAAYSPPPAGGLFGDVTTDHWAAAWIEQLAAEGITSGCGTGLYCPESAVTRAQMAVFIDRSFTLP